jgi:MFS family permease
MDFALEFIILSYLFGPAVAIPFAWDILPIWAVFLFILASHLIVLPLFFAIFSLAGYKDMGKRRVVRRISSGMNREIEEVRENTVEILELFTKRYSGFLGYYLAIVFISFSLGFGWAAVLAFSLKLPRLRSYIAILSGTILSFVFWYLVFLNSIQFIGARVMMLFGVMVGILLLFYGNVKENEAVENVAGKLGRAVKRVERAEKGVLRRLRKRSPQSPSQAP